MGFSKQEYWSGLPCPPLGDLPHLRIELSSLKSLALAGGFFTFSTIWEGHLLEQIYSNECIFLTGKVVFALNSGPGSWCFVSSLCSQIVFYSRGSMKDKFGGPLPH